MNRCDWCQEISELVPVVNRDRTSSHDVDFVCPSCAEVERFEHADEVLWNPLGFTPFRRKSVMMTASLNDRYAA